MGRMQSWERGLSVSHWGNEVMVEGGPRSSAGLTAGNHCCLQLRRRWLLGMSTGTGGGPGIGLWRGQ